MLFGSSIPREYKVVGSAEGNSVGGQRGISRAALKGGSSWEGMAI